MGIRLGIGGLKIGQRSGTAAVPFDWSSYWTTLINMSGEITDAILTEDGGAFIIEELPIVGYEVNYLQQEE